MLARAPQDGIQDPRYGPRLIPDIFKIERMSSAKPSSPERTFKDDSRQKLAKIKEADIMIAKDHEADLDLIANESIEV